MCVNGEVLHARGTQKGLFCVPPKIHHRCKSKKEARNADVRESRVSTLTMKGMVSEVSVSGDPPCSHLEVAMPAGAWETVHILC